MLAALCLITLAVLGTSDGTCPEQCECTTTDISAGTGDVSVECHGDNTTFLELAQTLPVNITIFKFVAERKPGVDGEGMVDGVLSATQPTQLRPKWSEKWLTESDGGRGR